MSIIGTSLAGSVAGAAQAERAEVEAARKRERLRGPRESASRREDEIVVPVEAVEAVRDLKGNDQEESETDRHSRPRYDADGSPHEDDTPRIDVKA